MAIEFLCAQCSQLVRTPDSAAGKKGKCPTCGHVQKIPAAVTPLPAKPAIIPDPAPILKPTPSTPAAPAKPEPRLPEIPNDEVVGEGSSALTSDPPLLRPIDPRAERPRTEKAPSPSVPAEPKGQPPPKQAPSPTRAASTPSTPNPAAAALAKVEYACPSCGKTTRAPATAVGKQARCPYCQAISTIPGLPAKVTHPDAWPPSAGPAPKPTTKPSADRKPVAPRPPAPEPSLPVLTPLGMTSAVPELTPISPKAPLKATPQPAASSPPAPSLAPLDKLAPLDGLSPIGGLTPINDLAPLDPLAPLGDVAPLQPAAGVSLPPATPLNPYASSAYAPNAGYGSAYPRPFSGNRPGLPWERGPSFGSLMRTMVAVVFTPAVAFREMWQAGGLGHAIAFAAIVHTAVGIAAAMFSVLFNVVFASIVLQQLAPDSPQFQEQFNRSIAATLFYQTLTNLGAAVFIAAFSGLVTAGITHGLMVAFGAARGGFLTTLRVYLYCVAAMSTFQLIPCCLSLIALPWTVVNLMIGVAQAHDSPSGPAIASVLVSVVVYYGTLLALVVVYFVSAISAALGT